MKKTMMALLFLCSFKAMAACASLDYEEMKDMDTKELTQTYCKYFADWQHNQQESVFSRNPSYSELANSCHAQVDRIGRLLKKREDGVQKIIDTCPMAYE